MAKKIDVIPALTFAAFTTFLTVFIVSLCVIRSADQIDTCELGTPRSAASALSNEKLHTIKAIRTAFTNQTWCPPRLAHH